MRSMMLAGFMLCVGSLPAAAEKPLTTGEKINLVLTYPIAIHQLPLTTIHEGSHWLTARAFGDRPTLHLLPSYLENSDGSHSLAGGYVYTKKHLSSAQDALVSAAPYLVQLVVVNGVIAPAYRHGRIPIDSFGDKYLQAALFMDVTTPIENCFNKDGDLGQLSRNIHVNRFVLCAVLQVAQTVSFWRVSQARGHRESTWFFYFHRTF